MQHKRLLATLFGVASVLAAPGAIAHAPAEHGGALLAGIGHPLFGLDHLLAMLAIGLWAAQQGARESRSVPATFFCMLPAGAGLALAGVAMPAVETGISTSVLVLGLLLAFAVRCPLAASIALVAGFGVVHGHAHGSALHTVGSAPLYGVGFLLTAAGLQLAGLHLGTRLTKAAGPGPLRASGLFIAGSGLLMWA